MHSKSILPEAHSLSSANENLAHNNVAEAPDRVTGSSIPSITLSLFVLGLVLYGLSFNAVRTWSGTRSVIPDTVVIYTYSASNPEYKHNLHFFVEHGMFANDGCEYVIIVQEGPELEQNSELPTLPKQARYVRHENKCYDFGTFGWAIREEKVDVTKYKYIIFMNSSVRGPFLPAYFPEGIHWSRLFTRRFTGEVKLVGSTISCEGTPLHGDPASGVRKESACAILRHGHRQGGAGNIGERGERVCLLREHGRHHLLQRVGLQPGHPQRGLQPGLPHDALPRY